MYETQDTCCYL